MSEVLTAEKLDAIRGECCGAVPSDTVESMCEKNLRVLSAMDRLEAERDALAAEVERLREEKARALAAFHREFHAAVRLRAIRDALVKASRELYGALTDIFDEDGVRELLGLPAPGNRGGGE